MLKPILAILLLGVNMDFREIIEFLKDVWGYIVFVLVIVLISTFIVSFQPVAGNSMFPTLEEGDILLVSRFEYWIAKPKRNDIVTLKNNENKSSVKRIIGLPGEKIEYLNNILYINNEPYKEGFLGATVQTYNFLFEDICPKSECPDGVIPKNKYLVLGDNRPESKDSRDHSFGLISKNKIQGKMIMVFYPFNRFGHK